MGEVFIIIAILIGIIVLFSLPLYICGNFVLWLFHVSFHLTLLQSFGVSLLLTVISSLFFKNKGGK